MRVLLATEKPFAAEAVSGIKAIFEAVGHEVVMLEKYSSTADLLAAVSDVEAIIVRSDKITAEVVERAKRLRIVVRAGAGYDNVDLAACSARGIVVMNTPGQNSNAVAELAIGMAVFMARNQFTPGTGSELKGKTLGIHAYGNVGRIVASIGRGFGMKILAFDPFVPETVFQVDDVEVACGVEDLYKRSDYLSLHIPATAETRGSIGYDLAMSMPRGGTIINTARKEVIDEQGLMRAMDERADLKYVADVAPEGDFSRFGKRFFATSKKMGAETAEANVNAGLAAANQIVDFFATGNVKFQVNK